MLMINIPSNFLILLIMIFWHPKVFTFLSSQICLFLSSWFLLLTLCLGSTAMKKYKAGLQYDRVGLGVCEE